MKENLTKSTKIEPTQINNHTIQSEILNSSENKYTLTALAVLVGPSLDSEQ